MAETGINSGRKNVISGLNKNLLILHFTVFIWGFTGILGQAITISAVNLVWYRVLIATLSLFLYFKFNKTSFKIEAKTVRKLAFTGALVGGHWILFFRFYQAFYHPCGLGLPLIYHPFYRHF